MRFLTAGVLAVLAVLGTEAMPQPGGRQIVKGPDFGLPFSPAVKAGGLIHLSGALATGEGGQGITGDIKAQTARVLDNLAALLDAAGCGLDRVASVNVYLRRAGDFAAMNEVYRTRWTTDPPVRTTVVADLVRPEALVEMSMVAIAPGLERRVIHPPGWMRSPNPFSYGIKSGDTLFLSGLVARNPRDNSIVKGDIGTQTRTILEHAGEILTTAGMSHRDVAAARVYITETTMFQDMNAAYRPFFSIDPPARATVRAELMNPDFLVEISLLAVQSASRNAITTPGADGSPGRLNPNLSSAIRVGNRLFVSGMLGNTADNRGDAHLQTRETLARIGRTLAAAGFSWTDVVDGVVYLTSMTNYDPMNKAYREVFPKDFPARATVGTGLVSPEGLVEIMLTAAK